MNNNIQEAYCSLEVCKILWSKGMKTPKCLLDKWLGLNSKPTHQVAIEWLRVNFGIWVQPYQHYLKYSWDVRYFKYKGHYNVITANGRTFYPECYLTPQEAIEAALLYTLKELI